MFYYYEKDGKILASDRGGSPPIPRLSPPPGTPVFYLVEGDPVLGRGLLQGHSPGQLKALHGPGGAGRLPPAGLPLDAPLSAALEEGRLTAVNTGRARWEQVLSQGPSGGRKRVNILAIGDVGSTLLTGLKLLGGDVIHPSGSATSATRSPPGGSSRWGRSACLGTTAPSRRWRSFPRKSCLTAMCSSLWPPGASRRWAPR